MKPTNDSPARTLGFKLVISRVIQAPCALVFHAWTDPVHIANWFGPEWVECRSFDLDVRIGGAYRLHMVSKNGDHIAVGEYREIIPNQRLQFTWERAAEGLPLTLVTVDFEDLGKATRLTLTHEGFKDQADCDDHNEGWTSLFEKFGRLIEQGKIES